MRASSVALLALAFVALTVFYASTHTPSHTETISPPTGLGYGSLPEPPSPSFFERLRGVFSGEPSITPSDDTYIRADYPSANYGGKEYILIWYDGGVNDARGFVKFDLSGLPDAAIESARLYCRYYSYEPGFHVEVWSIGDDSWSEGTLTWNKKPPILSKLDSGYIANREEGTWIFFDITDFVRGELGGDKVVSLCLRTSEAFRDPIRRTYISTKEAPSYWEPYLEISYPEALEYAAEVSITEMTALGVASLLAALLLIFPR